MGTPTGLVRTLPTNFMKLSWWIPSTRPSGATQPSNGSARLCTNTVSCVVLLLLANHLVVLAKDMVTARLLEAQDVLIGRNTIQFLSAENVNPFNVAYNGPYGVIANKLYCGKFQKK